MTVIRNAGLQISNDRFGFNRFPFHFSLTKECLRALLFCLPLYSVSLDPKVRQPFPS